MGSGKTIRCLQLYPMHNHDDYKVTNNGVYPGGQLTFIQTDVPGTPM